MDQPTLSAFTTSLSVIGYLGSASTNLSTDGWFLRSVLSGRARFLRSVAMDIVMPLCRRYAADTTTRGGVVAAPDHRCGRRRLPVVRVPLAPFHRKRL